MKQIAEVQPTERPSAVAAATLIAGLLVLAAGSYGPDFGLALLAAVVLAIGIACLWRPGEAPVLLFVFLYHWVQGSMAIFQATFAGVPLDSYFPETSQASEATFLTLCALVAMAVGMRAGAGPIRHEQIWDARALAASRPMRDWFVLYAASWCLGAVALYGVGLAAGLAQIFYGIEALRWAFFLMLAFAHFSQPRTAGWWFPAAFAFEFVMGIGGYFSDFQTVFLVTFLATMMAGVRLTAIRVFVVAALVGAAFCVGVIWTAIKPDYRQFVSRGQAAQVVSVSYPEQIGKLGQLVGELDQDRLSEATQQLFSRLSYVEFFGSTLAHVPAIVPHTQGELLLDGIVRPFTPRVFFPDKPVIDDTERTQYYSGRKIAGVEQGTSISLGWVAEMYIDFGTWGMMLAAAGVGLLYGSIQRVFTTWSASRGLLGFAMASAVLLTVAPLEASLTKVLGGLAASLIAAFLIIRFVVPSACPWLIRQRG